MSEQNYGPMIAEIQETLTTFAGAFLRGPAPGSNLTKRKLYDAEMKFRSIMLRAASISYYNGSPVLSDQEYDELFRTHAVLEEFDNILPKE